MGQLVSLCCCRRKQKRQISIQKQRISKETLVRDYLAAIHNGKTEIVCPAGRIDILTNNAIYEVKLVSFWKHAIGQVLCYHVYYPTHDMYIHLFGTLRDIERLRTLIYYVVAQVGVNVEFTDIDEFITKNNLASNETTTKQCHENE